MAIQRSVRRKLVLIAGCFSCGLIATSCGGNDERSSEPTEMKEDPLSGEVLYMNHCASCHGSDGKLGVSGASDLSSSKMNINEIKEILVNGRNGMPVMKEILGSEENIESVSNYVIELKQ
jgi:cytochrome c6